MFTGLIETTGTIVEMRRAALGASLRLACPWRDLVVGESIAVDGVCLTVVGVTPDGFTCDASAETLAKTTLGAAADARGAVHLERALRVGDRLGGHLVTGHVDGVGRVVGKAPLGESLTVEIEVAPPLASFLAPKASVAVDGVSLTVNGASGTRFDVVLVPITRAKTLLDRKPAGAPVNVEVDVLAKYVARLLGRPGVDGKTPQGPTGEGVTLDVLARAGLA